MMKTEMASGAGMKDFYRQKKKANPRGGVAKPSTAAFKKKPSAAKPAASPAASIDADIAAYSPVLSPHGSNLGEWPEDSTEEALQQFDMDMKFGPCLGITRLERWERAARLGLNPPAELGGLLHGSAPLKRDCLWEGRV